MMQLASVNTEQGLYVMPCGDGYSCYGFEVLDLKARKLAAWCKVIPPLADKGTRGHFEQCAAIIDAAERYSEKTRSRCYAELIPELMGLEGKRVEVVDCYGERRSFKVGKSTGWMPCHLELANSRSSGGGAAMGTPYKSVRVVS